MIMYLINNNNNSNYYYLFVCLCTIILCVCLITIRKISFSYIESKGVLCQTQGHTWEMAHTSCVRGVEGDDTYNYWNII